MKRIGVILFALLFISIAIKTSFAASSYVLPYPGIMPGNKLYKVSEALDYVRRYYSFGDFSQLSYNLSLSDKKLVEAKTLFEYNQYPLGLKALEKSDAYFVQADKYLKLASEHKKNISEKKGMYKSAAMKHIEVLESLKKVLPEHFTWVDEKKAPLALNLWEAIQKSVRIRKAYE